MANYAKQAYVAYMDISLLYKETANGNVTKIDILPECISYAFIQYSYENVAVTPIIVMCLTVSANIYSMLTKSFSYSKIKLKISKENELSNMPLRITVVDNEFSYQPANTSPNYAANFETNNTKDLSYRQIIIGLTNDKMTNAARTNFGGRNYCNTMTSSFITNTLLAPLKNVTKNFVIEPVDKDTNFTNLFIPKEKNTIYQALYYLWFTKDSFYDTGFTFFIDFDTTYLVSKKGKGYAPNSADGVNVIINIQDISVTEAVNSGFHKENGAVVVNVNTMDCSYNPNLSSEKVLTNITVYNDARPVSNLEVSMNNSENKANPMQKNEFIRSVNPGAMKNELETSSVMVQVMKQNLDNSIFTPNKKYVINNKTSSMEYNKYNGTYILSSKRELYYVRNKGSFTPTVSLVFKRIQNIEQGQAVINSPGTTIEANQNSFLKSGTKTSSANRRGTVTKATIK